MPKISKSQVYAVQWLVQQDKSIEEISTELNLTSKQVSSIITDNNIQKQEQNTVVSPPKIKDVMINQTAVKRTNSVAIMTKEASEIADEARKRMPSNSIDQQKGIFRPNSK